MNFLNNIWISISNPNENIIKVLSVPSIVLEYFLILEFFLLLSKINTSKKKIFSFVGLSTIFGLITLSLVPAPFNIFINYLSLFSLEYIIFKQPLLKTLSSGFLSLVIFNLVIFLILNPFLYVFNITSIELTTIPIYRFIYLLIIYSLNSLIIYLLKKVKFKFSILENIDRNNKFVLIFSFILGILAIVTQSIILFYYVDKLPIIITFLNFIFLVAYFSISIYSLIKNYKLLYTTEKLESSNEYINTLKILHDNIRGFKHDFDNIVTTIGGYIQTNDIKGLKEYYVELEDDCQRVNNLYFLSPELINNDGIYNLLTKKYHLANSKNIKVNLSFLMDLNSLKIKIYDFSRILGILLDNAIEASSESDEKIINLSFRNDAKNSRQLIIIENTFLDKNIDTETIFNKGISSKENHSGIGLWEVRNILKKYKNTNLYTTKNEKFFIQQIEIYY